jgi:alpha-galactosidase
MKAVVIGAASANFGPVSVYDLLSTVLSSDGELALVDVRETELRQMAEFAALLARRVGSDARVTWSTDRTEVLKRADTVIVSAEVDRLAAWEADWEIPHRYGIGHTLGENRGPAGLSHTLRTAPLVVAIARDIERMAPDAVMFIMTNPEDRLAYAVRAYTSVDAIGYCDGLWDFRDHVLGPALDMRGEDIYVDGAGINHAVWIRSLIDTRTGSDLYPRLREAGTHGFQPLGQHLYRRFGLWPMRTMSTTVSTFPTLPTFLAPPALTSRGIVDWTANGKSGSPGRWRDGYSSMRPSTRFSDTTTRSSGMLPRVSTCKAFVVDDPRSSQTPTFRTTARSGVFRTT